MARVVTAHRILVAGAGGFIGTHLVRAALARGLAVTALVRTRTARLNGATIVEADLTTADLPAILGRIKPSLIINAASYGVGANERDEARMSEVNLMAVRKLLDAAKATDVTRFIQLGTYSEYGDQPGAISEDTPTAPKEAYARTKAEASSLITAPDVIGLVESIVLRLFNVWGPFERPHRLLPQVIRHCRKGARFPLTPGTQIKEWCYVEDVASWVMDIAFTSGSWPYRIVNLGSGVRLSVRDMALAVANSLNGEHLLDFGAVQIPAKEVQTGPADLTRVNMLLPDRRFTPIAAGIAATIATTP